MECPITQFDTGQIAICGYDARELSLFAEACRRQRITEDELRQFCLSFGTMVVHMRQPIEEDLKETLTRIYGHSLKWED